MRKGENGVTVESDTGTVPKFAFIGVRACELHAIAIQDRVFAQGPYPDMAYTMRRQSAFIVAVNCGQAGETCFCVSMETGPKAESGFDLALTELIDGDSHEFLVEVGSDAGAEILKRVPHAPATDKEIAKAAAVVARTENQMGRRLETEGLRELLLGNLNHPRWDDVAERCLTCGNCTMVCPTCFCTTVEDHSDLSGTSAERVRKWDSCFTMDFSFIHGGSVRNTARSRYRQWMTHKLATWIDQFGTSGCVGCGRCITWCPVGIDITVEAAAIRANPQPQTGATAWPTLEQILQEHPFFAGAPAELIRLVAGCARNHIFHAGEYLFHEGEPANEFFLIRARQGGARNRRAGPRRRSCLRRWASAISSAPPG